jgi:hypothetical protein
MGERMLGKLAREMGFIPGPVAERAAETVRGRILDPHATEHHFQRHDGERLAGPLAGENIVRDLRLVDLREDRERGLAERNAMLARRLHALGRDSPDLGVKIDLRPSGSENFPGSRRRQDGEFQRERGHGLPLS